MTLGMHRFNFDLAEQKKAKLQKA